MSKTNWKLVYKEFDKISAAFSDADRFNTHEHAQSKFVSATQVGMLSPPRDSIPDSLFIPVCHLSQPRLTYY
jgi:hypothetical protein